MLQGTPCTSSRLEEITVFWDSPSRIFRIMFSFIAFRNAPVKYLSQNNNFSD